MTTAISGAGQAFYHVGRSSIHGKGLFASRRIRKNTLIGVFDGPRVYEDGRHVLWVCEENGTTYAIHVENDLKYANHSSNPNTYLNGEMMYALRTIEPGEEITFHYGEDWQGVV